MLELAPNHVSEGKTHTQKGRVSPHLLFQLFCPQILCPVGVTKFPADLGWHPPHASAHIVALLREGCHRVHLHNSSLHRPCASCVRSHICGLPFPGGMEVCHMVATSVHHRWHFQGTSQSLSGTFCPAIWPDLCLTVRVSLSVIFRSSR